ncbi:MAG: hypothetical protein ACFFCZ_15720 [Promethearchaeota archaeon]
MTDNAYYELTMEFQTEENKNETQTFKFDGIPDIGVQYRTLTKTFFEDVIKLVRDETYSVNGMVKGVKKIVEDKSSEIPVDKVHVIVISPKGQRKLQLGFLFVELEKYISIIGLYPEDFHREANEKPYLFQNITAFIVTEPWRFQWGMYAAAKENLEKLGLL